MKQVQEALANIGIPVPTQMAEIIRDAMYAYGFFMMEESDKGYNHPAYDPPTKTYTVQWTWVWREQVDYGR